jgi:hypothetical protein
MGGGGELEIRIIHVIVRVTFIISVHCYLQCDVYYELNKPTDFLKNAVYDECNLQEKFFSLGSG